MPPPPFGILVRSGPLSSHSAICNHTLLISSAAPEPCFAQTLVDQVENIICECPTTADIHIFMSDGYGESTPSELRYIPLTLPPLPLYTL